MKTIDILNLWSAFNRVYEDSTLTPEEKCAIGEEVLIQLPHAHLVPSVQRSLYAVSRSIRSRVDEMEKLNGSNDPEDGRPEVAEQGDGTNERKGTAKPKQLLRKAKSNA
jgi:hypothetical protein